MSSDLAETLKFLLCDWSLISQEPFDSSFFGNTISAIFLQKKQSLSEFFKNSNLKLEKQMASVIDKGGLPSESFSFWLKSPKYEMPNHNSENYPPIEKMLRIVILLEFEPK